MPSPPQGSVAQGIDQQQALEHEFLDAAPRPIPEVCLSRTRFFKKAKRFQWKRVVDMLATHPKLINCTTSKARWAALMQAAYVAHIF